MKIGPKIWKGERDVEGAPSSTEGTAEELREGHPAEGEDTGSNVAGGALGRNGADGCLDAIADEGREDARHIGITVVDEGARKDDGAGVGTAEFALGEDV